MIERSECLVARGVIDGGRVTCPQPLPKWEGAFIVRSIGLYARGLIGGEACPREGEGQRRWAAHGDKSRVLHVRSPLKRTNRLEPIL